MAYLPTMSTRTRPPASTPDTSPALPREGPATGPEAPGTAPRTPITAEAIHAALAAHPTRTAAAASLGVDLSSLRRTARRLGLEWPTSDRAPGSANGRWSEAQRRETARAWMRDRRALARAARESAKTGPVTIPAPPPVASHPRAKRKG